MSDIQGARNTHCSNCGDTRGGPVGHEISECTWQGDRPAKVLPVTLAPPDGMNSTSYTSSLMGMYVHDSSHNQHLTAPMLVPTSPMQIAANRSGAARFLLDDSDADYLLFIDSDMGFQPDALDLLLAAAHPTERPIVGALCFGMRKEEQDGYGGFRSVPFPTIYDWRPEGESVGFVPRYAYSPDAVTRCAGTGAAFLLIHRGALERIRESLGDEWFTRAKLTAESEMIGEDLSFCLRAGGLGIPIYVHTGVRTTHLKPVWVGEEYYLGQRALAAAAVEV